MRGILAHLLLTLRLNLRSKQALVYGYVFPIFFLIAFGSIFGGNPPLYQNMGQLITITALGGACFGLPTAMVAERERGVWRRYRLLPTAIVGLIFSTIVARFLIILSAAIMQILLAHWIYHAPWPQHGGQMLLAFAFVSFAFLGLGLVIAMLADTVPAVQALGQSIFLPMIMIGGVGVPFFSLPEWARKVAEFLPGRYAVRVLDSCMKEGHGLRTVGFPLIALVVIGVVAGIVGVKLFRWDMGQRIARRAWFWIIPALGSWVVLGAVAIRIGDEDNLKIASLIQGSPATMTVLSTMPATTQSVILTLGPPTATSGFLSLTAEKIDAVSLHGLQPDDGTVTPFVTSLDDLDEDGVKRMDEFRAKLREWGPGGDERIVQRARNFLSVAGIVDLLQDKFEPDVPLIVFDELKAQVPRDDLIRALAWIALHPDEGTVVTNIEPLGFGDYTIDEAEVRDRVTAYSKKMLARLLGKPIPGDDEQN